MRSVLYIFGFLFVVSACVTKTKIVTPIVDTTLSSISARVKSMKVLSHEIDYTGYVDDLEIQGEIKLIADSIVWINGKKFGMEVFRLIITNDTSIVLDRFHKKAYIASADKIQSLIGFDLSVTQIQRILMGIPVLLPQARVTQIDSLIHIDASNTRFQMTQVCIARTLQLMALNLSVSDSSSTQVSYQFQDDVLTQISTNRILKIGKLVLKYDKFADFNRDNIRFKVPKKYEIIQY
jgi:hypothetical protein